MSKMSTDLIRHALNGPTMGTRWSALYFASPDRDPGPVRAALAEAVTSVDQQMSTWNPASDLMRLNRAEPGEWVPVPAQLMEVLVCAMDVGRLSDGAFDIGMGEAVTAWGFGPQAADPDRIAALLGRAPVPTHDLLDLDPEAGWVRKRGPVTLDLSGIAKGYGVDRMMAVLAGFGIHAALASLDGDLAARGLRPDARPWTVAIERPDPVQRATLSVLALEDAAVATSGDYRHWVEVCGRRLSHTMDPRRGCPLNSAPASVTVMAPTCMQADAWATALMVQGSRTGAATARRLGISALFIDREGAELRQTPIGPVFQQGNIGANPGSPAAEAQFATLRARSH